jgi:hypothetical protein
MRPDLIQHATLAIQHAESGVRIFVVLAGVKDPGAPARQGGTHTTEMPPNKLWSIYVLRDPCERYNRFTIAARSMVPFETTVRAVNQARRFAVGATAEFALRISGTLLD